MKPIQANLVAYTDNDIKMHFLMLSDEVQLSSSIWLNVKKEKIYKNW